MKHLALLVSLLLAFSVPALAKEKKIRGYVTKVISPTAFEIKDYRITKDINLVLEFEKDDDDKDKAAPDFRPEDIRVGTELEIRGEYDEKTGELRAKSIKVVLEETKKIKRTALIEQVPQIQHTERGWEGTFFADGQHIRVDSTTAVLFKPNKSERKTLEARAKTQKNQPKEPKGAAQSAGQPAEEGDEFARPLNSLDEVKPNTFMTYEGTRDADGTIVARKVTFMLNELESGEAKMWKNLTPKVKEPNFPQGKPGEVRIAKVGKFKLLPNQEAQSYVQHLGQRLIPAHQKALPAGDPNKIPFRFFLVQSKDANAFALPNGTMVVFSGMFEVLENEAQLAAVLGHEISHSIQEHSRLQQEYHRKKLMALQIGAIAGSFFGGQAVMDIANMIEAAVRNGYSRSLENQADRTGLGYMLAAGYDTREAPRVWKLMAKKYGDQPANFFYSSHDNHTKRRSYLMCELSMNYPDIDYGQLRRNEAEYDRIARIVVDVTTKKKKTK